MPCQHCKNLKAKQTRGEEFLSSVAHDADQFNLAPLHAWTGTALAEAAHHESFIGQVEDIFTQFEIHKLVLPEEHIDIAILKLSFN
jgi:hypothetical protein